MPPALTKLAATVKASPLSHSLVALLTALVFVGVTIVVTPDHTVTVKVGKAPASATSTTAAPAPTVAAVRSAATLLANTSTPPPCDPAPGAGKLGACAPHAAIAAAARATHAVARSASYTSPYVGNRPIGVDVSSYQGCSINWSALHVKFAFFKATEGTGYTDSCLARNVASAKRAHLPYGAYDFLRPGRSSATAEADHFAAAVRGAGANTSLPPVADVEANSGLSPAAVGAYVCAWHARVRALLHRSVTITYTGAWFWNPQVAGSSCHSLLWVSAYAFAPIIPHSWARHLIWQYSDGIYGPGPHINRWDSDVFSGTLAQLHQLAGAKAKPAAKPVSARTKVVCRKYAWYGPPGRRSRRHHTPRERRLHGQRHRYLLRHRIACSRAGVATRK